MDVDINLWAVLLAGLSSMVVGSLWYLPKTFGNMWMKLSGVKMDEKMDAKQSTILFGSTFIASLITAFVLAHMAFLANQFYNNSFLYDALMTAFWLWLGFTAARIWVHDAFEYRPPKLTLLNSAHELVTVLVMALIIGLIA